jgi:hypothetical protein
MSCRRLQSFVQKNVQKKPRAGFAGSHRLLFPARAIMPEILGTAANGFDFQAPCLTGFGIIGYAILNGTRIPSQREAIRRFGLMRVVDCDAGASRLNADPRLGESEKEKALEDR